MGRLPSKSNEWSSRAASVVVPASLAESATTTTVNLKVVDASLMLANWRGALVPHWVHVARDFFPVGVASSWIAALMSSWQDANSSWLLATNNDGRDFGRKVISRDNIEARRALALARFKSDPGAFAYVKWELDRRPGTLGGNLHSRIRQYVDDRRTREAICVVLGRDCPPRFAETATLGDFFVTLMVAGDFLTPHSDASLGSVTVSGHFVVIEDDSSATAAGDGDGALEFFCHDTRSWCVRVPAANNELVAFRTQPESASHRVTQMSAVGALRFGFTGFFALPGEAQVKVY
jgi:hypothetical protein